ncbi:MAG: nicotinamide-nucleotide adenylyltransferase [Nitrososphaera sp.]
MERKARQEMTAKRGLMLGRFQPFHNGHLALARQILGECDELVIAIGSAQFNFIGKDPFTAGERIAMIHGALEQAGLEVSKCYLIPIPNDENNARWLANLRSMVPEFDYLYSGNGFVRLLARSQDPKIKIIKPKFKKKREYNGSSIRNLILTGGKWRLLVPPAVAKEIERVGGVERMRILGATSAESSPQSW